MKSLAAVILVCVTCLAIATEKTASNYFLEHQQLEIQELQLRLEILKFIQAHQTELIPIPQPQKPSLDLRNLRG